MPTQAMRLKNSAYTPEEERQFKILLYTFRDYLANEQDFFEVLYSEKLGRYLEVILEKLHWQTEPLRELDTPDSLFDLLLCQMADAISEPRREQEFMKAGPEFTQEELAEVRRRTVGFLARMPDPALQHHYIGVLDRFILEETKKAKLFT